MMRQYILKRLLLFIPTLLGLSVLVFLIIHMVPGDPVEIMLYPKASPEAIERLRAQLGLDQPVLVQYWMWLSRAARFDLGTSVTTLEPVMTQLARRVPSTVELSLMGMILGVALGLPLGVISAINKGRLPDYLSSIVALTGVSMPVFWLGLMLIWAFSVSLGWLPISGRSGLESQFVPASGFFLAESLLRGEYAAFWDALRHIILPAACIATWPLALVTRVTRSSMLEVLNEDYVRTARAKGLPYLAVVMKHALRNALIPVVTVTGLAFGSLLSGAVLTETVFAWPGVGSLIVRAIYSRDYPMIQGAVFLVAFMFVSVNLIVDILYVAIDPRIRYD
ncbi:MAG: ABC transporter permease [Bacillota bacterium]